MYKLKTLYLQYYIIMVTLPKIGGCSKMCYPLKYSQAPRNKWLEICNAEKNRLCVGLL